MQVLKTTSQFRDKGRSRHSMLLYGHGDGGGGPTYERVGEGGKYPVVTLFFLQRGYVGESATDERCGWPSEVCTVYAANYTYLSHFPTSLALAMHDYNTHMLIQGSDVQSATVFQYSEGTCNRTAM